MSTKDTPQNRRPRVVTRYSNRVLAAIAISIFVAANVCLFFNRRAVPPPQLPTQAAAEIASVKSAAPQLFDRIERDVTRLQAETLEVSLQKLSDVNLFYWPGPRSSGGEEWSEAILVPETADRVAVEAILSNRRYRKVLDDLSKIDKNVASELVRAHLSSAIAEYRKLYDADLQRMSPMFETDQLAGETAITGPVFAIGNVPEDQVTLPGVRLKVLSLHWAAGTLGLAGCRELQNAVVTLALQQRTELYENTKLHPFFKAEMLKLASLYNRQVLATGVMLLFPNEGKAAAILDASGCSWLTQQLVSFRAAVTEFDLPVQSGVAVPDDSFGSREIRILAPMSDQSFDSIIREL